jgi:GNAT superfamily N-acetyltransferase
LLALNECAAIYAGGFFGEIADVYVLPPLRSAGIGGLLINAAVKFGRNRGWPFLEVGAPGLPRWQRTVDFYNRLGFKEIGPRLELSL